MLEAICASPYSVVGISVGREGPILMKKRFRDDGFCSPGSARVTNALECEGVYFVRCLARLAAKNRRLLEDPTGDVPCTAEDGN